MRFLIIGYGFIGRHHLMNLRALGYNDVLLYRKNSYQILARFLSSKWISFRG